MGSAELLVNRIWFVFHPKYIRGILTFFSSVSQVCIIRIEKPLKDLVLVLVFWPSIITFFA